MDNSRLYRLFQPTHYTLHINLEREKRHFSGTVTIKGEATQADDHVLLHAHKLHVTGATIDGQTVQHEYSGDDSLLLHAPGLTKGAHETTVQFEGKITNPMHGLYPCYFKLDGKDEELLATQFESHHAREVFPCIDEPEAKATFDLSLTTETSVTVISNAPQLKQYEKNGELFTSFQTTPRMSTYLLAWVVGKLDYQEATTKDGVKVRAFATPDKKAQLGFAVDTAVKCLEFYNDYFDIAYPLPKCDLIALPDFSSGAMENWGCITFREAGLLASKHTATRTRQYIVMVIAHELAHQWFGNLVTMKWWNDLWLNESFANWIEYLATDYLYPDWDMWTQYFDSETTHAFERDALASVQKIQQEVHTPAEIQTLFDPAIVYAKGGSLLNMLHAYLGAETFRDGLRIYLKRHAYTNTEANDLWSALGEVAQLDVVGFMQPWISQSGVPVVTIGASNQTINLHQRRFFSNPKEAGGNQQALWPIPLLTHGQLSEELLDKPSISPTLQDTAKPLLLNQGRTGYYLSMYNREHIARLAELVLTGSMPAIDRLGLLSDSISLTSAGLQPMSAALELLKAYQHESSEPVWGPISEHVGTLKMFAGNDDELLTGLRRFVATLAHVQFERLGWEPIDDESYSDKQLRPLIIAHMAYAEDKAVTTHLRELFDKATKPADIWADIRSTVYATAMKFDGQPAFEKLLTWHAETTSAEERTQLIAGLTSARDPQLIKRALAMLTTDAVKLQDLFYWVVYLTRSRFARELAWHWIQDNWQWIVDQFGNDMHYADFPKYSAAAFSTADQLASYRQFFEPKLDQPELKRAIQQGIEDIESRVLWRERDQQAVETFLRSQ